jgi:hypothetical protein
MRQANVFTSDLLSLSMKQLKDSRHLNHPEKTYRQIVPYFLRFKGEICFSGDFSVTLDEKDRSGTVYIEYMEYDSDEGIYITKVIQLYLKAKECRYWGLRWYFYAQDRSGSLQCYTKLYFYNWSFVSRDSLWLKYQSKHITPKRAFLDRISGYYDSVIFDKIRDIKYPYRNGRMTRKERSLEKTIRKSQLTASEVVKRLEILHKTTGIRKFCANRI